jgi:hypothetical protein
MREAWVAAAIRNLGVDTSLTQYLLTFLPNIKKQDGDNSDFELRH